MASLVGGKPPVADAGEEINAEQLAVILGKSSGNIRKARLYDVRWEGVPVKFRRYRDRNALDGSGFRIESQSLMPIWLRDLWPTHDFDPRAIWDADKQKALESSSNATSTDTSSTASTSGSSSKKADKAPKVKAMSKKELIQAENAKKLYEDLEQKDLEKLKNAGGKSQRSMLISLKMATPFGRLSQLLEILSDAVESRDKKTTFDVFWAIESLPLYIAASNESNASDITDDTSKDDDKKKSSKKDKDDKKSSKDTKKDTKKDGKDSKKSSIMKKSKELSLVSTYKKVIKKAVKMREEEDIIVYQLTDMADRLPPLSRFNTGWKLDDWQKRVLEVVDQHRSAIVCAPTSSGKTVISSYVASDSNTNRVLFVVPTEPLVWQVAALFHKLLKGSVGLCMDQMHFRPDMNLRVIVGTPQPLETALSKLRGPVGDEALNKVDYAQMQGGFTFDYAIYDEVHSLDGDQGAALQRLIQGVNCNFLALSATIGNASQLKEWWSSVRKQQLNDIEMITADEGYSGTSHQQHTADTPLLKQNNDDIFLEEHSGRFINLQRMVWSPTANNTNSAGTFKPLHPLSAVTMDMLTVEGGCFHTFALPFTPNDTYALWQNMIHVYPDSKINDLQPADFFAKYEDARRITLSMAKDYEDALCNRIELLAKELPNETKVLLDKFHPGDIGLSVDIAKAAWDIKSKDLCPAIMFHLDSFHCLSLFKELLADLEVNQKKKYPNYIKELQDKADEVNRLRLQAAKRKNVNAKEQEEEAKDGSQQDMDPANEFIDAAAPHPEFILAPPTSRLSSKEYEDICNELAPSMGRGELKHPGHAFLRALRRGFGIYIDDASFPKYRRIVQKLAQQGKLAFVFSDESLAYGVNMPFRTCCFCESMDNILTPLLAQQMSGRAGRRGLDTQGNLLFMNMSWPRIQYLMLGTIPAIEGQDPLYPTIALQHALSKLAPAEPFPPLGHSRSSVYSCYIDEYMVKRIAGTTLKQFISNDIPDTHYLDISKDIMQKLGYMDEYGDLSVSRTLCVAMWELREFLPESMAIASMMDMFLSFFAEGRPVDYAETPAVQIEFCGLLLLLIDRVPCEEGSVPLQEHSFYKKAPDRNQRLEDFLSKLSDEQSKLEGLPEESKMRLPVNMNDPVDSRIFAVMIASSFAPLGSIDSLTRFQLVNRLRKLGGILMVLHNVLMLEDPYDVLETILRKSFARVKYIIAEVVIELSKLDDLSDDKIFIDEETRAKQHPAIDAENAINGIAEMK